MYFKLFVLLAVAAGVSHSAAVSSQSSDAALIQLIKNAYFRYIKEHQIEDNHDQLIQFIMKYETAVTTWLRKIRDVTSLEYKELVAAQHGNTVISTDEQRLREQFYELYGSRVIENALETTFSEITSSVNSNVNEVSHHEDNSQIFQELISNVNRFSKETVNQISTQKLTQQQKQEDLIRSHNAHYSFANTADNNIEGNYLHRLETRKDGKVYGRYSYDDGNVFVTRYYFADENGFRIVKEFNEPSKKKGHQLNGEANVDFVSEGGTRGYHITAQDIHKCHDSIKPVPYGEAVNQIAVA